MTRQKRALPADVTPALLTFREKRKWQIALRRYVLLKQKSIPYAPYFGVDVERIRQWFEIQFDKSAGWDNFGKKWQFDHIIPVNYFDFSIEEDLKMCWHFTNIRVEILQKNKERGNRFNILAAKGYFESLYKTTQYKPCLLLLQKLDKLALSDILSSEKQQTFITHHRTYLDQIENYSAFEFERLNSGSTIEQVLKEVSFLKKF